MKVIKKYKNRRLYDTETSRYITFDEVKKYVLDKIDFKVHEASSDKDLTKQVLMQILLESGDFTSFWAEDVLKQMIIMAQNPITLQMKKFFDI